MAKLVSLFWRFSVVHDAIECIFRFSCGVNVVVVSVECFLFLVRGCGMLEVLEVLEVLGLAVLCRVIPILRIV